MRQNKFYTYLCSFCGKEQDEVRRLIAGPHHIYVCDECVAKFSTSGQKQQRSSNQEKRACSFCGKPQNKVQFLIDGPTNVHICDECVDLCQQIIDEQNRFRSGDGSKTSKE